MASAKPWFTISMAREYDPEDGNRLLLEEIKDFPRLYPVWVIMHHHTGEFPAPQKLLRKMKEHNIRAVRIFPSFDEHRFNLAGWNCGELFSMLEERRIPFMMGMDQISWEGLHELLCNYPEMRFILTDVNYLIDRNIYALFEKHKHLHIETIGYKVSGGIAEICRRFGAERLVFGSRMPFYSRSAAVAMVTYASVNEEDKRRIASGNLENLLGGVRFE